MRDLGKEGEEEQPLESHLAGTKLVAYPTAAAADPGRFGGDASARWSDYSAPAGRSSGGRTAAAATPPPEAAASAAAAADLGSDPRCHRPRCLLSFAIF